MDFDILFLCAESKHNYDKYRPYIKNHVIQSETVTILETMGEFYKVFPGVISINWEPFSSYLFATYAMRLTADKISIVRNIIKKMETFTPTLAYDEVIKTLIEMDYVARIADECGKVRDGSSNIEAINSLTVEALRNVERYVDKDEMFVIPDIGVIVDRIVSTGYEWRLMALNRSLGLLRTGNFVIVAARVEVGKTTFLASEASYIAPQLPKDRPIVWVNNEEESEAVFFRVVQAALGKTTKELVEDKDKMMADYVAYMGGNAKKVIITKGDTNDVKTLTALFKDVNPGMIIFDTLDKISGFHKEEREDLRLGRIYKWGRECAREYGPVIAASQLNGNVDTMKDPPFIGMDALRGSKTDKPGEADAIITIGKYQAPSTPEESLLRTINIPKNKLPGGGRYQVEGERHGQYMVKIDPLRARYE
ncbi:DNA helicase, DnaB-like, C-terminal [uncultured Caudovirales phage]|uniref:DNA helicase, DnaB-like, C-terminal n=1 Tax=uncultured Caudovirales phage TaxID=2100421 RepID=A0A6J5PM00_9CAUD|nr:DNA helicase, DnaB-like, C-terminal [uncultured Caudovirales phage]CAB4149852.1 DNA helicase, DnaB-like, C-terminal [uncultured Caudovirales phage]CAB4170205.1 DNA helicase, DnaB-like, C-terminal [uncultured Caudovirales phage]CAB4182881.1 DNA helicase, DnaB-like, C-terminal [uncultured Caudovirales phage]CAB4197573.1 DNA helicase, DnaB-like, C-terminal [uncultured Caudovirales phage]